MKHTKKYPYQMLFSNSFVILSPLLSVILSEVKNLGTFACLFGSQFFNQDDIIPQRILKTIPFYTGMLYNYQIY